MVSHNLRKFKTSTLIVLSNIHKITKEQQIFLIEDLGFIAKKIIIDLL